MGIKLFFHASALFAAVYSKPGGTRQLVLMAIRGEIQIVVSQDVLDETVRNLERKAPEKMPVLKKLFGLLDLEITDDPTSKEVKSAEAYVAQKDAPIIAAVKRSKAAFFVTFDKKHLLENPSLVAYTGTAIGTSQEAIAFVSSRK